MEKELDVITEDLRKIITKVEKLVIAKRTNTTDDNIMYRDEAISLLEEAMEELNNMEEGEIEEDQENDKEFE